MRGSGASRLSVAPGGALAGPWVRNPLWRNARAVPSLDLQFADNKSLVDGVTGQNLVTFTRASRGTFVSSDGVLRSATTNLLLQSEDFSTSWSNSGTTETVNATTAPNGTNTADEIIEDTTNANHILTQNFASTSGTVYSFSCYLKAGVRSFAFLDVNGTGTLHAVSVNLSTGAVSTAIGSPTGATSIVLPNGWYRVAFSYTSGTTGALSHEIRISTDGVWANRTYTGNGTGSVFAWGAQLEQSSTVGEYIPTTSTINSAPRFDHRITSSTTNLLLRSEEFDTSWVRFGTTTLTTNTVTAPNGTLTADNIVFTSASSGIYQSVTGFASTTYTFSIWIKSSSSTQVRIVINTNLSDPVIQTVTVTSAWQRFNISKTTSAGTNSVSAQVQDNGSGGTQFDLWGAQLEQSSTVGPYVPTTTAAATSNTTESLGLLVEEARTNGVTNNTMVGAVAGTPGTNPTGWTFATAQSNGLTIRIVGTGVENGINYIDYRFNGTTVASPNACAFGFTNAAAATSQTWTSSLYWKLASGTTTGTTNWQLGIIENTAVGTFVTGAFYTQTTPTSAALITQRPTATRTLSGGVTVGLVSHTMNITVAGNTAIDFTIRIGMPQIEQGAFATSVIPTTTATVTRAADVASITGSNFSSWYNAGEGTIYHQGRTPTNANFFSIDDGTVNNRITSYMSSATAPLFFVQTGGAAVANLSSSAITAGSLFAQANVYKAADFAMSTNGGTVSTTNTGAVPVVNRLAIGVNIFGSASVNGTIKRLAYFPTRLSNTTLQQITQ